MAWAPKEIGNAMADTAVAFALFQFETTIVSTICYTCHQQDDDEYCQLQRYK